MSIHAPRPRRPASLEALVDRAGGVRTTSSGRPVVTGYGSAAGELAACVSAVGLADCSQLTKLVVTGPAPRMRELTVRLAGTELAPGGLVHQGGIWWCCEGPGRLLVLCEPGAAPPLCRSGSAATVARAVTGALTGAVTGALTGAVTGAVTGAMTVADRSAAWAALAVVGHRAGAVLGGLGVYGPSGSARAAAPVAVRTVASVTATWVLQADDRALAVLPRADAPALWDAITRAGRPWGMCPVGQQAIARYALLHPAGTL